MSVTQKCKNEDDCQHPSWCKGKSVCLRDDNARIAEPMTLEQQKSDRLIISKMHVGNRFRLMFGQPLLPETNEAKTIS